MKEFDFTIHINFHDNDGEPFVVDGDAILDRITEPLFEAFEGNVLPSTSGATAYLDCTVVANRLSDAVDRVLDVMSNAGLGPSPIDRLRMTTTVEVPSGVFSGRKLAFA